MEQPLDNFARRLIRDKACQIAHRFEHVCLDRDDLESLLIADLLKRHSRFDESRSKWSHFVTIIINHAVAELIAWANRHSRLRQSPDWDIEQVRDTKAAHNRCPTWHTDLKMDLDRALGELSEEERQLCDSVAHETLSEAARRLSMSRGTAYSRLREIRRKFERRDLDQYL